jgi:signal transduction histidine kinase
MNPEDAGWLDRLAHDLRGPLAPLQTASYRLQREDLDPARRQELLAMLERQTRRLGRMLDELDDWAKAGRGRLLGQREPCEPVLLLDYALVGSGIRDVAVDDDGNIAVIDGDSHRLTQLFRILFDYAAARGGIAGVALRSGDGDARIRIGVGGDPAQTQDPGQLFDKPQAEPYDEGLGLRLLLAREIARAHGGELSAAAATEGIAFECRLPLAADTATLDQG